jgi:hypothetical protein
MSNNYWDDEDEDDTTIITGNESDNDLQKKLRKKIKADEKRMKELEEKLDGYVKKERESSVKELLEKQGVNPKAARLILKDLEEVTPETVTNWLDENGDLFGFTKQEEAPVDDSNLAELRKQNAVTQGALTPDRAEDLEMRISQAQSQEELNRILSSQS